MYETKEEAADIKERKVSDLRTWHYVWIIGEAAGTYVSKNMIRIGEVVLYLWESVNKEKLCEVGYVFRNWLSMDWIHLAWVRGPEIGSCQHSNRPYGFIKCEAFFDHLSNYELLKNECASFS